MKRYLFLTLLVLIIHVSFAQVRLPALVSDSMVLQRDTRLKIWGWAAAGEKITVLFQNKSYRTVTQNNGEWSVSLPPMKAGGPYTMRIAGSNAIVLNNVLVGDVWLCAGQSNMVHYLDLHKDRYAEDIASADFPMIRQFLVPPTPNLQSEQKDLSSGQWKAATRNDIGRFSVVAYFFARDLHERYRVPIGLINTSVGGTPIEAWISEQTLREFPASANVIQKNKDTAHVHATIRSARLENDKRDRHRPKDAGLDADIKWYDPGFAAKNWSSIIVPGYWEDQGHRNLDGVVWYRKEIDIPASMCNVPADIRLGRVVDADELYVNGVLVGKTSYQYPQRRYVASAGLLKPGKNVLTVRVVNTHGKGGFVPDKPYHISAAGETVDLKGEWKFKVGAVYSREDLPVPTLQMQNQPAALFNGMIAPLTHFAMKGMLWYQGESNADNPRAYGKLLSSLINDWRGKWKLGELPFLIAQLPNFMDVDYLPAESNWALLREAQEGALRVANTGVAVTIDLGEWNDIHPGNKKPIGERLALLARRHAYGDKSVVDSGPRMKAATIEGNQIVVEFSGLGTGLVSIDGEALRHFSIAGADKKFVNARAIIRNNTVVISSDKVNDPKYVRYAWADNPAGVNLYNQEGLPAAPFRTDQD